MREAARDIPRGGQNHWRSRLEGHGPLTGRLTGPFVGLRMGPTDPSDWEAWVAVWLTEFGLVVLTDEAGFGDNSRELSLCGTRIATSGGCRV